jgi:cell division protein FtsQ
MARKSSPTILQDELYPPPDQTAREELHDARLIDLEVEQESPFLRAQKRVSARRGSLPKRTAVRLVWAAVIATLLLFSGMMVAALYHYGEHSWRFRVDSSDDIEIAGSENVNHAQIMEVMGGDIGRNIFFVPLAQRKLQLEQIPWVESASVMRFVPNRLRIEIHERTPVAFVRVGSRVSLLDCKGTVMDLPAHKKYSFPVIVGMNPDEPLSSRSARMKAYDELVRQLDGDGAHYSQDLSEVDLADPDDVKILTNDPLGEVLVHLGSGNYLDRYKIYVSHVREWREQFAKLDSVDLRYDRQIVVNPDLAGPAEQTRLPFPVQKAAVAADVRPAAVASHRFIGPRPVTIAATGFGAKAPAKSATKPAAHRRNMRTAHRRAVVKRARKKGHSEPASRAAAPSASAITVRKSNLVSPLQPAANLVKTTTKKPSPAIRKGQENP